MWVSMCVSLCVYLIMCAYLCVSMCVSVYLCVYVCIYVCGDVCVSHDIVIVLMFVHVVIAGIDTINIHVVSVAPGGYRCG